MKILNWAMLATVFFLAGCVGLGGGFPDTKYESSVSLKLVNKTHQCTAVHISGGEFLTAAHCLGPTLFINGNPSTVIFTDEEFDIALLSVLSLKEMKYHTVSCVVPRIGTKITVVGAPLGIKRIHTFGNVASNQRSFPDWPTAIWLNVSAGPGSSGSPVYNEEDKIIGIVVGGLLPLGGLSIMVSGLTICKILNREINYESE